MSRVTTHVSGGRRTIVVMAVVAVVCLALGLLLSRLIVSPGQAAANAAAPTAGPITVPVESRVIANEVLLRGDVGYDDPVDLAMETGDLGGPAVVTGQVKEVGATVEAASVALEVVGRPVIVLPGELPTYRTLRSGVSGPDVQQLKHALRAVGLDGGDPGGVTYDAATAAGVRALYQKVGYEAPTAGPEVQQSVEAAQEAVTGAQASVRAAEAALSAAGRAAAGTPVAALDGDVQVAEARLAYLTAQCAAPLAEGVESVVDCSPPARVEADAALATARAARAAADVGPDTTAEREAVRAARDALTAARETLAKAQAEAMTPLPATEVVYLPSLPRRVDAVEVERGGIVQGDFMSLSGATVQITASASRADAELLVPGTVGTVAVDGTDVPVTVAEITAPKAGADKEETTSGGGTAPTGDRRRVVLSVGELTPEQLAAVQGTNVRVRIPVSSTDGEVLAVPLAALTAGPGGESRLELVADGGSRLVEVTTGLAASGYVEIAGSQDPIEAGDLVVVGISPQEGPSDDGTPADGSDPDAEEDA
ncbi:hypothetical protein J1G42_07465 [Cellulomonas sp. zg-ZUI222]|uniref:hypothetical protein n=1 Tax=Cellulomonas wangleii TaxID=2816956 RepID=UPI001A953AE5|nr:hypothetical protein [Cellulomonas wangleii]MBO0920662.1 hypothetical protein [Cellulomonas wangleii]